MISNEIFVMQGEGLNSKLAITCKKSLPGVLMQLGPNVIFFRSILWLECTQS